jgi:hypothetical protein
VLLLLLLLASRQPEAASHPVAAKHGTAPGSAAQPQVLMTQAMESSPRLHLSRRRSAQMMTPLRKSKQQQQQQAGAALPGARLLTHQLRLQRRR